MSFDVLTDDEFEVVAAVRLGLPKRFATVTKINAELVRRLALRLELPPRRLGGPPTGEVKLPGPRLHIENARIEGVLDIEDIAPIDGQGALTLVLEKCVFAGDPAGPDADGLPRACLKAAGAHFARFSLKGSQFPRLELAQARINGDLDLRGVHGDADACCWVRAQGVEVGGSVRCDGAKFGVKARDKSKIHRDSAMNFALDLAGARVRGKFLFNAADAIGGIALAHARIEGDVWITSAEIKKGEGDAIFAWGLKVGSVFVLRPERDQEAKEPREINIAGAINLNFAEIGGCLELRPTTLRDDTDAITAWCAKAAWLTIGPGKVFGSMIFDQAQIAADATVNVELDSKGYGASFDGAQIRGSFKFEVDVDHTFNAKVSLDHAEIGANLELNGVFKPPETMFGEALSASHVQVKGNATLGNASLFGTINFDGAHVEGDLMFGKYASCNGSVSLRQAYVGKDFTISGKFTGGGANSFRADPIRVKGNVLLDGYRQELYLGICVRPADIAGKEARDRLPIPAIPCRPTGHFEKPYGALLP